jgi:hypothetical protein
MNILCPSRDLSLVAFSLVSSTVGSYPNPDLDICLNFSFPSCLVDVGIMTGGKPFFQTSRQMFNPLNADLNPICHLLALLAAYHILHVSRVRATYKIKKNGIRICLGPSSLQLRKDS